VLLLDDVLSELDEKRQDYVLNCIAGGQVMITCCAEGDISKKTGGRIISIKEGAFL
jgi:DNA replication and repair protein RecF